MAWAPEKILVTGANGFVGQHALRALRKTFPAVRLVGSVQRAGVACPGADDVVALDLREAGRVDAIVASVAPDAVLHLAAQATLPASFTDPLGTWSVNLNGTLILAEAVMRHVPKALFVQASSAEVYGLSFRSGCALAEDAPFAPANPYAASKAAADIALGEMALRGLRALRMRPFNQVGPGQTEDFAVSAFARQIARIEAGQQEAVIRAGALDRWRDMLDVRDVCAGYVMAMERGDQLERGAAINLASGQPRRIGDILQALIAMSGIAVRIETDPGRLRPTDLETTRGDARRAAEWLGWAPSIPWEQTLRDVLEDWRRRLAA